MTSELLANLRIAEGQEFARRAEVLAEVMRALEEGREVGQEALQEATASYFSYLSEVASKLGSQPGTMAEFAAAMHHFVPVPGRGTKASALHLLFIDLSVLYAANHLHFVGQSSEYYENWQRRRTDDLGPKFSEAEALNAGAETLVAEAAFGVPIKAQIFELMAEVLHKDVFKPQVQLGEIKPLSRITPAQLFALQIWQRHWSATRQNPASAGPTIQTELSGLLAPINGSIENTLLYWIADPDPAKRPLTELSDHLFKKWGWIRPIDYSSVSSARLDELSRKGQLELDSSRDEHPLDVARVRIGPSNLKFPFSYSEGGPRYGFETVPIVPVGGTEYGKTSFLCAFADLTTSNGGQLANDLAISTGDLQALLNDEKGKSWRSGATGNTAAESKYRFEVGHSGINAERWAPLEVSDYMGEDSQISKEGTPAAKAFEANLARARGIFFFVDDRVFPESEGGKARVRAEETAAWYQKRLRDLLRNNINRHLPMALVINKADIIFGNDWVKKLGTTQVVIEGTQRGIGLGTGAAGEPGSPYKRLMDAIRYNKDVSRDDQIQKRLLEFIGLFEAFLTTMLDATYRYQMVLTTSVNDPKGKAGPAVQGVLEAMSWMIGQLLPPFDRQAATILDRDIATLDTTIARLEGSLVEADQHQKQLAENQADLAKRLGPPRSAVHRVWDRLIGKTKEKLEAGITFNQGKLDGALRNISDTAQSSGYDEAKALQYPDRRSAAERGIDGLRQAHEHLKNVREEVRRSTPPTTAGAVVT